MTPQHRPFIHETMHSMERPGRYPNSIPPTAPGWLADPSGNPNLLRWWDGEDWTEHTKPSQVHGWGASRYARKADKRAERDQLRIRGWRGYHEEGWYSGDFWKYVVIPYAAMALIALWILVVAVS